MFGLLGRWFLRLNFCTYSYNFLFLPEHKLHLMWWTTTSILSQFIHAIICCSFLYRPHSFHGYITLLDLFLGLYNILWSSLPLSLFHFLFCWFRQHRYFYLSLGNSICGQSLDPCLHNLRHHRSQFLYHTFSFSLSQQVFLGYLF